MAREIINGIGIAYELMGKESDPAIVLTPGGRFPMITAGLKELGEKLVAGGRRVLLWDRPNCGQSDFSIVGDAESEMHGEALSGLIRKLDLGPMVIAGGSAGSRITLITASRNPDLFTHVVVWWITGGHAGLAGLMRTNFGSYGSSFILSAILCMVAAIASLWIGRSWRGRKLAASAA